MFCKVRIVSCKPSPSPLQPLDLDRLSTSDDPENLAFYNIIKNKSLKKTKVSSSPLFEPNSCPCSTVPRTRSTHPAAAEDGQPSLFKASHRTMLSGDRSRRRDGLQEGKEQWNTGKEWVQTWGEKMIFFNFFNVIKF